MYDLDDYGRMLADKVRMDAYAYALKAAIKPESVVLDIGAGTGIHALLACKFGARKVYAIEPNDAIYLAQELAHANGFGNRIEFIHDLSTRVTLPEPADVIVSDLRGVMPLFTQHIPSIIDARQRHLAPGGVLIPQRDALWAALVEARHVYRNLVQPWDFPYGLSMEPAKQIVLNSWSQDNTDIIRSRNLLTEPKIWSVLEYATIENPDVGGSNLSTQASRDGTAHGLLLWFDAELAPGIGFSNSLQTDKITAVYGRAFFPLLEPVTVTKGDVVSINIQATLLDEEYEWRGIHEFFNKMMPTRSKPIFNNLLPQTSIQK